MSNDEEVKNEQQITAEKEKQVEAGQRLKDLADVLDAARKRTTEQLVEDLKGMERQLEMYEKLGNSEDARKIKAEQALAMGQTKLELLKEQLKQDPNPQLLEEIKNQDAANKVLQKKVDKLNNATKAIREGRDAAKALGDNLGNAVVSGDLKGIFNVDNMVKLGKALYTAETSITSFGLALGGALLSSFVSKLIELSLAVDEAESGFKRATGASDSMAKSLTANYEETRRLGVSLEEMSASMQSLYTSYTDFTMINESAQKEIAKTGALLGEIGVGADDFSKGMQLSTKAFGLTAQGATAAARDIADFSTIIGVTPQQLGSDFANVGTSLAKMGDQGVRAFKDLAIVSKTTGLEMSKVLQITDKFDTFEGAAEQAGKLNAALGGNFVNAMDLMMATDPAERFNMIRDSILDTGLTFDDMSYYQRKFYTDALGLSDVSDLAAMLSGDMSNLEGTTQKSSDEYAKLAERTKNIQSLTESFKNMVAELTPILTDVIKEVQDWMKSLDESPEKMQALKDDVREVADLLVEFGRKVIWAMEHWYLLVGAFAAFKIGGYLISLKTMATTLGLIGTAGSGAAGGITAAGGAMGGAAPAAGSLSTGITSVGQAATASAKGLLALGAAVLMIGGGIAIAALGIAELVKAFSGLGDAAPYAALGMSIFVVGMVAMVALLLYFAPAIVGATIPLLAFGAAVLLIGGGIALAAAGIGYMAKSFGEMFTAIDIEKMTAFGVFLAGIAMASVGLGIAAYAMGAMAGAIGGISLALLLVPEHEMALLGDFLKSMSTMDTSHMDAIAEGIGKINTELERVPENKALALETTMKMATISQATAGLAATAGAIKDAVTNLFGDKPDQKLAVNVDVVGEVLMDGQKVGKFVRKEVGKMASSGMRGTG